MPWHIDMANALTLRMERFCQKYIETGNASEAYRLAYDAKNMKPEVIHVKACELLKNGKVAVRVNELRERLVKRHDVTLDSITDELEQARLLAMQIEQPSAAVSAAMGKAKIHGHITDVVRATIATGPLPEQDKALLDQYVKAD